jgi:hypothetical protein
MVASSFKLIGAGLQSSGGFVAIVRTAWMMGCVELPSPFELLACPADRFGTTDASGTTGASDMCFLLLIG